MILVEFFVPGNPIGWARTGHGGRVQFTPAPQRNLMAMIRDYGERAWNQPPFAGPVALTVLAQFSWPQRVSARKKEAIGSEWRPAAPDHDNLGKLVADALNGVVFIDDRQIVDGRVLKYFSKRPGYSIRIEDVSRETPWARLRR